MNAAHVTGDHSRSVDEGILLQVLSDALPLGVLVVNADQELVSLNQRGHSVLGRRDPLVIDQAGRCRANCPDGQRELDGLFSRAVGLHAGRSERWAFCGLTRASTRAPLMVQARAFAMAQSVRLCVLLHEPESPFGPSKDALRAMFRLTPAEADLASALLQGATLEEHARAKRVTRNTVKSQLAHVLEKTGTHRQTDLLRLLMPLVH
ncbi:MAG: hypothetical protein GC151_15860 [Betaproteobacteria bacterium]|nr:hypothetical protein [Betaproteobacteria bacterium]